MNPYRIVPTPEELADPFHPYLANRAARVRAAERGTSVSALVSEYLASLTSSDTEYARLEDQQRRIVSQIERFSASDRLEREDLHERALR